MKSSTRQLLLEILLLHERYTIDDFDRVTNHLLGTSEDRDLLALTKILTTLSTKISDRNTLLTTPLVDPTTAKDRFLTSLKGRRSASSEKRVRSVLKKLGISDRGQFRELSYEDMIIKINQAIDKMNDEELTLFLKPYKVTPAADEGYLGLANYIMHKGE